MRTRIDACQFFDRILHNGHVTPNVRTALPVLSDGSECHVPLVRNPMDDATAELVARRMKALGDPTRLKLLALVAAHENGEACVCDLIDPIGLSQPTVSHHLKLLVDAGLLRRDKRGVWAFFSLVPDAFDGLADLFRVAVPD